MTYGCGILVREGLVMIGDTRTNAGLDNISTFRKLHIFEKPGERVMMIATAGNLRSRKRQRPMAEGLRIETHEIETLANAPSMFAAVQLIGRAVRKCAIPMATRFNPANSISTLRCFGGNANQTLQFFMVYAAGNFIEATDDTPYLQIGEHKYGKPVLDRAVSYQTDLYDVLKLGLISLDSTMRSNLSVGLPIDVALLRRDALTLDVDHRIDNVDSYFHDLRDRWSIALRQAHQNIPRPPYGRQKPGP
jgi:putative proteasome-type protease